VWNDPDDANWDTFWSGQYHVVYGCLGLAVVGISLVVSGIVWLGICVLVLATGILVDVWAHGFNH
jgi:hypothetical protein